MSHQNSTRNVGNDPVPHPNHASQYVSLIYNEIVHNKRLVIVYNESLAQYGISASTGTVGDSYDNAADNLNDPYNKELIHTGSWADGVEVKITTFEWVNWWNESRLHQSLGYRTPAESESELCSDTPSQGIIENKVHA